MRPLVLFLLLLAGCATARRGPDANCAWRVCVTYVDTPSGRALRAVNREPVPVTIVLTFRSSENLRPGADLPIERVVPRESNQILLRLRRILRDESIGAGLTVAIDLGSSTTEPDADHLYAVPFGGDSRRELIQGFNGPDTHLASMRYSLDFAMPEGTPVLAARAGTVLYVQDGFTVGRPDPDLLERANLVVVAHSDGTMASYGHLTAGIPVSVGRYRGRRGIYWAGAAQPASRASRISISTWVNGCCVPRGVPFRSS